MILGFPNFWHLGTFSRRKIQYIISLICELNELKIVCKIYLDCTLDSILGLFLVIFWSSYLWSDFDMKYTFWNIRTFKEDNGDIFARGTQDMKSVGIQHIEAIYRLKVLQKKKFKRTIHMWWVKDTGCLFSECT